MTLVLYFLLSLALIALAGFGWAAYTGRPLPTQALFAEHAAPVVDFAALEPAETPNRFLACPVEVCPKATPDLEPPVFAHPPEALFALVQEVVTAQPHLSILTDDAASRRLDVVQRTPVLGFPDTVSLQVLPAGEGGATLAILSRSRYGTWDFGKNGARVKTWLAAIERAARS